MYLFARLLPKGQTKSHPKNDNAEAYLKPCQISVMKVFCKIVNDLVNYFHKKLHHRCLTGF